MLEQINQIASNVFNIVDSIKYFLIIVFSFYFIFSLLNRQGLKRESSFDISIIYLVSVLLILKLYFFGVNLRSFSSLSDAFLNFNFTEDAFLVILLLNLIWAYLFSRIFNFSRYRILDVVTFNSFFVLLFLIFMNNWSFSWLAIIPVLIFYFFKNKLVSGVPALILIFVFSTINLIFQFFPNGLIFYLFLNIICAIFIYKRFRYMDNHLTKDFIEACRLKLLERRERILQQIATDSSELNVRRGDVGDSDPIDEAYEVLDREIDVENKGMLETILARINKALKKIDDGKYGYDEKTGKPIEKARLEEFPEAEEDTP